MSVNKNKYFTSALHLLNKGVPLAIPTETVYGLAASISNPIAIRQIFAVKERPIDHPLIIHVSSIEMAEKYGQFSPRAFDLVRRFWPGPLTVILPKKDSVPLEVTGGRETVGIRQPNHPLTLRLIQEHGCPIAAPSANRFGRVSPTSAEHVLEDFNENEEEKIQDITENIVKLVPTLIEKKIDTFSSKVNQNLNGI